MLKKKWIPSIIRLKKTDYNFTSIEPNVDVGASNCIVFDIVIL